MVTISDCTNGQINKWMDEQDSLKHMHSLTLSDGKGIKTS